MRTKLTELDLLAKEDAKSTQKELILKRGEKVVSSDGWKDSIIELKDYRKENHEYIYFNNGMAIASDKRSMAIIPLSKMGFDSDFINSVNGHRIHMNDYKTMRMNIGQILSVLPDNIAYKVKTSKSIVKAPIEKSPLPLYYKNVIEHQDYLISQGVVVDSKIFILAAKCMTKEDYKTISICEGRLSITSSGGETFISSILNFKI